jgi:UDP-sugar transporter A1/2/3
MCYFFDAGGSSEKFSNIVMSELLSSKYDWLTLAVPSLLYTVQNILQYYSMSMLSAPVFQVLYQMKIITTAILSVFILSKRIGSIQWVAVVALAGGVALVQLSQLKESSGSNNNSLLGLISVLFGCLTSGFAGVYFEKVLKSSKVSVWVRNIQLALIGTSFALVRYNCFRIHKDNLNVLFYLLKFTCYTKDRQTIEENGFLFGYNSFVWGVILLQAVGGMVSWIFNVYFHHN